MKLNYLRYSVASPLMAVIWNILMLYLVYAIARGEFLLLNLSYFQQSIHDGNLLKLFAAGCVYDTPGIFYTNILWIALMLWPLHWKENTVYYKVCKWIFIIVNIVAFMTNIADSIYFSYTMRRTTADVVGEFSNEGNLVKIVLTEILRHWYLVILIIAVGYGMWKMYFSPTIRIKSQSLRKYYAVSISSLAIAAVTAIAGIRGGLLNHWYLYLIALPVAYLAYRLLINNRRNVAGWLAASFALLLVCIAPIGGWRHRDIRPITISNAGKYTSRPTETALILNTPFTLIRSIGNTPFSDPHYFDDKSKLNALFSPIHLPDSISSGMNRKNVVIIIIESFGREYIGAFNKEVLGPDYKGYTPFTDSLITKSLTFRYSFCNGRKSIDAMPSILSGIPMFVKPFILTPQALNKVEGIPAHLNKEGYKTAFFHGARTGSMGFDSFARTLGFQEYYGREDFNKDSRFRGDKDFDGYWAIWDEPFMQYFALTLSDFQQPFMAALFTASSHHPFNIPDKYKDKFPEESLPIHKCIRYTDNALREFFNTARKQPWYDNTIFVITSDHTNMSDHTEYKSDIGGFSSPIIFFDPSGSLPAENLDSVAQQIDIMPTILSILHYDKPFLSFGRNLLSNKSLKYGVINQLGGIYQYINYGYVLQFDGEKTVGIYSLEDYEMKNNLIGKVNEQKQMEQETKAIIQSYMDRMLNDRLTP